MLRRGWAKKTAAPDMLARLTRSRTVGQLEIGPRDQWADAIRVHDRRVVLSLLAMGLGPDQARELAQAAWTRLMEKQAAGELNDIRLPGLVIRQARFLALDLLAQSKREPINLAVVPDSEPEHPDATDLEREVDNRRRLDRTLAALAECSPKARRVFRLVYGPERLSHADAAREAGISLQRVRQTLCETRQRLRAALAEENEA